MAMTEEEIEAGRSPAGGFTKKTLAKWGVPWPPPKGWREALMDGKTMREAGLKELIPSETLPYISADELLKQAVLAVVEAGHASDLYDLPDVLAYFGARTPDPEELIGHTKAAVR